MSLTRQAGRAGRTGLDTLGECYLFCKRHELDAAIALLGGSPEAVTSCLEPDLKRAVLEAICCCSCAAGKVAVNVNERILENIMKKTLLYIQSPDCIARLTSVVAELIRMHAVQKSELHDDEHHLPTELGWACFRSGMPVTISRTVEADIHDASEQGLILADPLQ